jgi:hypothetical protein
MPFPSWRGDPGSLDHPEKSRETEINNPSRVFIANLPGWHKYVANDLNISKSGQFRMNSMHSRSAPGLKGSRLIHGMPFEFRPPY